MSNPTLDSSVYPGLWYAKGLRFHCKRCCVCCIEAGPYAFVYMSPREIRQLARFFNFSPERIRKQYCEIVDGEVILKSRQKKCILLKEGHCAAYAARPDQCRTWPFWASNLEQHLWEEELPGRCPGIGKGRLYSVAEIEAICAGLAET